MTTTPPPALSTNPDEKTAITEFGKLAAWCRLHGLGATLGRLPDGGNGWEVSIYAPGRGRGPSVSAYVSPDGGPVRISHGRAITHTEFSAALVALTEEAAR